MSSKIGRPPKPGHVALVKNVAIYDKLCEDAAVGRQARVSNRANDIARQRHPAHADRLLVLGPSAAAFMFECADCKERVSVTMVEASL